MGTTSAMLNHPILQWLTLCTLLHLLHTGQTATTRLSDPSEVGKEDHTRFGKRSYLANLRHLQAEIGDKGRPRFGKREFKDTYLEDLNDLHMCMVWKEKCSVNLLRLVEGQQANN